MELCLSVLPTSIRGGIFLILTINVPSRTDNNNAETLGVLQRDSDFQSWQYECFRLDNYCSISQGYIGQI